MVLILHIMVALASLAASTYAFIAPSQSKVNVTYGLTLLTVASGTLLVVSTHSPLLSSCLTGLTYVSLVLSGVFMARRKLASQEIRIRDK